MSEIWIIALPKYFNKEYIKSNKFTPYKPFENIKSVFSRFWCENITRKSLCRHYNISSIFMRSFTWLSTAQTHSCYWCSKMKKWQRMKKTRSHTRIYTESTKKGLKRNRREIVWLTFSTHIKNKVIGMFLLYMTYKDLTDYKMYLVTRKQLKTSCWHITNTSYFRRNNIKHVCHWGAYPLCIIVAVSLPIWQKFYFSILQRSNIKRRRMSIVWSDLYINLVIKV